MVRPILGISRSVVCDNTADGFLVLCVEPKQPEVKGVYTNVPVPEGEKWTILDSISGMRLPCPCCYCMAQACRTKKAGGGWADCRSVLQILELVPPLAAPAVTLPTPPMSLQLVSPFKVSGLIMCCICDLGRMPHQCHPTFCLKARTDSCWAVHQLTDFFAVHQLTDFFEILAVLTVNSQGCQLHSMSLWLCQPVCVYVMYCLCIAASGSARQGRQGCSAAYPRS